MRKETQEAFDYILDTFSGADGGYTFSVLLNAIRDIDKQAEEGKESSEKIISIMKRFSKLIKIITKEE